MGLGVAVKVLVKVRVRELLGVTVMVWLGLIVRVGVRVTVAVGVPQLQSLGPSKSLTARYVFVRFVVVPGQFGPRNPDISQVVKSFPVSHKTDPNPG